MLPTFQVYVELASYSLSSQWVYASWNPAESLELCIPYTPDGFCVGLGV